MDDSFVWLALQTLLGTPLLLAAVLIFGMFMVVFILAMIVTIFAGVKDDL